MNDEDPTERAEHLRRCAVVKQRFFDLGVTIGEWADKRGYNRELVYAVLSGRVAGTRGIAHRVAIDLGIKVAPDMADEINQRLMTKPMIPTE